MYCIFIMYSWIMYLLLLAVTAAWLQTAGKIFMSGMPSPCQKNYWNCYCEWRGSLHPWAFVHRMSCEQFGNGVDLIIGVQDRVAGWSSGGDWKWKWFAELQQGFGVGVWGEFLYLPMGDGDTQWGSPLSVGLGVRVVRGGAAGSAGVRGGGGAGIDCTAQMHSGWGVLPPPWEMDGGLPLGVVFLLSFFPRTSTVLGVERWRARLGLETLLLVVGASVGSVRGPFLELWMGLPNWSSFLCHLKRTSSTSVTSSAIVVEIRLTWLTNSVLEATWACWDLSVRTAAEANSFAEDPSNDLRYWWLLISLARLLRSHL